MGVAADERQALCALFDEVGPDAPTLCEGWLTKDLAAHLVVREHRPDAALGILVPGLDGHTRRVQDGYAAEPWPRLVERVRSGPAWFWPTSIPAVDELVNSAEFLVHHEDVRRARPGWEPRPADGARDAAAWKAARMASRMTLRSSPVGVVLRTPAGRQAQVRSGDELVGVVGEPVELLLFVFGRDEARVEFEGTPDAVERLRAAGRGL
ncbi:TIGR03085 family metal-binding protein [Amycolatopsis suaedae]|uniref:TIGR03085 family protein n=1 Tax=Amycolatopsis suaedae TaxID=2510978 RepID=A0A4V2ELR5_9PSEU|nr:TIGR03085 family metal-binding protein [Amycolatopsis suaedae]RZQ62485.1 TIGR03085 family protein [Amycolatopsis suaedae]